MRGGLKTSAIVLAAIGIPTLVFSAVERGAVSVAVRAGTEATVGIAYPDGGIITCRLPSVRSGEGGRCTAQARLTGTLRTHHNGGAAVVLSDFRLSDPTIPLTDLRVRCSGGIVGSPPLAGTQDVLAAKAEPSNGTVTCSSWTGTVVGAYDLVVAVVLDGARYDDPKYDGLALAKVSFNAAAVAK